MYKKILGDDWDQLPLPVQKLHTVSSTHRWQGRAQVQGSDGLLARIVARVIGFPKPGSEVPVTVTLTKREDSEVWLRDFDGQQFQSVQWAGSGDYRDRVMERFGMITVRLVLELRGEELHLVPEAWTFLKVPLPLFLLPNGVAFETASGESFVFDVTIKAPMVGQIVAYRGALESVAV